MQILKIVIIIADNNDLIDILIMDILCPNRITNQYSIPIQSVQKYLIPSCTALICVYRLPLFAICFPHSLQLYILPFSDKSSFISFDLDLFILTTLVDLSSRCKATFQFDDFGRTRMKNNWGILYRQKYL